ncbi:uncharacterized protein LOC126427979 [Schistocerca serialis cubense]|uniref:uncharacterized protein LOC126427979 n=1 Tax=Schistocerca serialis cubense TaxID=2023355 RepID=UPI00214E5AE4|nr:uncharacterized protein LOC126427979 [Schistocerca serialis cubense]
MGCKALMIYATAKNLYKEVCLAEIAERHRRKTGADPVIAVDGPKCVQYLYKNCDFSCGGQYKKFREACRNFVQGFRTCGVRLVFFFHGLRPAAKNEKWVQVSKDVVEKINQMWEKLHVGDDKPMEHIRLPEGLIPCARVFFRDEPSTEVRLCMEDYNRETAEYAASCENCLGVMSNNGNFLIWKDVPCTFIFHGKIRLSDGLRMLCISSSDVTSDLGIKPQDLPALATFLGNGAIDQDTLQRLHKRLCSGYVDRGKLGYVVAQLVKNKTIEEICRVAFGKSWRDFHDSVKMGIGQYEYKTIAPYRPADKGCRWSGVLQNIEARHRSGEIPAIVLSVALRQTFRISAVLEDLSHAGGTSTGEALQPMRRRMYTVLLWESGDGPFHVEEQVTNSTEAYQLQVEVEKRLPPNLVHPGLLQLWSGDLETRWRLFSWVVGGPDPEGSALRSLEPQCLVVPAIALHFLRHEPRLLSRHEAEIFAVVAITVCRFTPQQLDKKNIPAPDPHAIFLATLFVRTTLHVLDVAAVCGLSFPREADCHLDAYFDGKFFQELYLRAKAQSFQRVGTHAPWDPSYLKPIHKLLDVIERNH